MADGKPLYVESTAGNEDPVAVMVDVAAQGNPYVMIRFISEDGAMRIETRIGNGINGPDDVRFALNKVLSGLPE